VHESIDKALSSLEINPCMRGANLKWPWPDRDPSESSPCELMRVCLASRLDFLGLVRLSSELVLYLIS
jgi:hypothetical protein